MKEMMPACSGRALEVQAFSIRQRSSQRHAQPLQGLRRARMRHPSPRRIASPLPAEPRAPLPTVDPPGLICRYCYGEGILPSGRKQPGGIGSKLVFDWTEVAGRMPVRHAARQAIELSRSSGVQAHVPGSLISSSGLLKISHLQRERYAGYVQTTRHCHRSLNRHRL